MNITFIGCGDAFSEQDKLGNNSALLEFNGTNLLIDIPDSNYNRMKHIGKTYSDIENLFITHLHGDHINGFERFTYYRQFATPLFKKDAKKVNLYIKDDLYFGFWDSFKNGLGYTAQGIKKLEDYYEVHLIEGNEFTINDVTFNVTSSTHVPI